MKQHIIYTNDIDAALSRLLDELQHDRLFVLCDSNTRRHVLPLVKLPAEAHIIEIAAGDSNKNLQSLAHVWTCLSNEHATRHSLLINIGGGMVTDLGGFAAASFKRGIHFINMPTTLLGAVDAAVGGKTGINFNGLKNEVGAFAAARAVIISTRFFATLPQQELLSGYAEMLKHGLLIGQEAYNALLAYDIARYTDDTLLPLLQESVHYKETVIEQDPHETSLRKVLNAGHTVGHAFESHAMLHDRPIAHGYAVAWGLVCELLLAHRRLGFPTSLIYDLAHYIEQHYGAYHITCDDYAQLIDLMSHDKKNQGTDINFTLLARVGSPQINCTATRDEIEIALDVYRDLFHL